MTINTDPIMTSIAVLRQFSIAAINDALAPWQQAGRRFHVLALLPEASAGDVPLLQQACRTAGIEVAGALFPELFAGQEALPGGVILLRVDDAPPPLLLDGIGQADSVAMLSAQVAGYVEANLGADDEAALFCIFDAMVPNIATHLESWYLRLADRVGYFGVNAGNERFVATPCLFDSQRLVADGVLLQLLPCHPGACLEHGYHVPERVISATSAQGNRIVQIDWRPALEVYRELMLQLYGVVIDRDNFYSHAVHFPFGILRADGEVLVRIPVGLGDDGSIFCVGEIPPNSLLTLLDARSGAGAASASLVGNLQSIARFGADDDLLLFYCAGRRMHMGPAGMAEELQAVAATLGAGRVIGALSLGEIGAGSVGGYPLFHNATLVGVPWPTK